MCIAEKFNDHHIMGFHSIVITQMLCYLICCLFFYLFLLAPNVLTITQPDRMKFKILKMIHFSEKQDNLFKNTTELFTLLAILKDA